MTAVQSVNVGLEFNEHPLEATTPTTPRAPLSSPATGIPESSSSLLDGSAPTTPTRANFGGLTGQRPLPSSPFRNSFSSPQRPIIEGKAEIEDQETSHSSIPLKGTQDVDMEESDEGEGGSDAESIDAETGRPSKKKKGQRFFCTDFPPCKLSFTRSEHLARHIRKHTGERPFACHCSRRFSRLDNLRQHAQTVHVNEEIPGDSLAATGTRFQRQIRTDKVVRPANGRSRASTASSQGSHPRGHARNLSTSSIGSTASTISRDDGRRRPPPLMMANDPASRARLSLEILRSGASTPPGQASFYRESSEGVSTPTSITFSTGQNSPGYGSPLALPLSAVSRSGGNFWDSRSHGRRLSVPSGPAPFQSPQSSTYGSPYLSPLGPSTTSEFSNSFGNSASTTQALSGRDAVESELRRRTWHPHTYYTNFSRPATSGLSYYQTPDAPRPAFAPQAMAASTQPHRLPGIETFDQAPRQPQSPPAVRPGPMYADNIIRPPLYPGPIMPSNTGPHDRRGHASWDMSLHQNLTKLDIANSGASKDPEIWAQQKNPPVQTLSDGRRQQSLQEPPIIHQENQKRISEHSHYPSYNANRSKRQGWYAGPPRIGQQATGQTPSSQPTSSGSEGLPKPPTHPSGEQDPSIMDNIGSVEATIPPNAASTSHIEPEPGEPPQLSWPLPTGHAHHRYEPSKDTEMSGLEVLVAVATREDNAVMNPNV